MGFGILTTALKKNLVSEAEIEDAVEAAARLNKAASEALGGIRASAATDVTGYGLLGHLAEVLRATGVGAVIRRGDVPVWERAEGLAAEGHYPGGLKNNRTYLGGYVTAHGVDGEALLPLYDPQTSGGLLVSAPPEEAEAYVRALRERGETAAVVGEVVEEPSIRVTG